MLKSSFLPNSANTEPLKFASGGTLHGDTTLRGLGGWQPGKEHSLWQPLGYGIFSPQEVYLLPSLHVFRHMLKIDLFALAFDN